jgi:hypothetical protein
VCPEVLEALQGKLNERVAKAVQPQQAPPYTPESCPAVMRMPFQPLIASARTTSSSSQHIILIWLEQARLAASQYGESNYGRGNYTIEVCANPHARNAELGGRAIIYHHPG